MSRFFFTSGRGQGAEPLVDFFRRIFRHARRAREPVCRRSRRRPVPGPASARDGASPRLRLSRGPGLIYRPGKAGTSGPAGERRFVARPRVRRQGAMTPGQGCAAIPAARASNRRDSAADGARGGGIATPGASGEAGMARERRPGDRGSHPAGSRRRHAPARASGSAPGTAGSRRPIQAHNRGLYDA